MRDDRLRPSSQQLGRETSGAARIRRDLVLQQSIEDLLRVRSIDGYELIPDLEREGCRRQPHAIDRIDEEFAVVNVDAKVEASREVRWHAVKVVSIVQARDVGHHDLVEIEVVLCGSDLVEAGGGGEQIEPERGPPPLLGARGLVVN